MEDKIEVGEYYRTKNGLIRKIKTIKSGKRQFTRTTVTLINGRHRLEDIVKHSKQLIDLIEVGDIVNRHLIIDKYEDVDEYGDDFWYLIIEDDSLLNRSIREENIQTILTRESYMANCYKVGEEDE